MSSTCSASGVGAGWGVGLGRPMFLPSRTVSYQGAGCGVGMVVPLGGLPRSGRPSYRPRPPPGWSGRGWWAAVELLALAWCSGPVVARGGSELAAAVAWSWALVPSSPAVAGCGGTGGAGLTKTSGVRTVYCIIQVSRVRVKMNWSPTRAATVPPSWRCAGGVWVTVAIHWRCVTGSSISHVSPEKAGAAWIGRDTPSGSTVSPAEVGGLFEEECSPRGFGFGCCEECTPPG